MEALRISMAGPVTSFRYPHFVHGIQPSYKMPPPATLYGHVCSALGRRIDPDSFRIAMHFTYVTSWMDYEHIHLFGNNTAKLSPFERELLFQPRLILYVDRVDWLDDFRWPQYMVTLGRSQDLMTYQQVEVITLEQAESGYIEHTIVPLAEASAIQFYVGVTMPRYIDPERRPFWHQYAQISQVQPLDSPTWIDKDQPRWRGRSRTVNWLSFV